MESWRSYLEERMGPHGLTRNLLWRRAYDNRRYMEHLPGFELEQRLKDIMLNLLLLTGTCKIGLLPTKQENETWFMRFTEVLEEYQLRFGPYPAGLPDGFLRGFPAPLPSDALSPKAVKAVERHTPLLSCQLVKYGRREHLAQTLEHGIIRLSPASSYSDPSLNHAMRDNELELSVYHSSSSAVTAIRAETDYYVYCLSSVLSARLFLDFDHADACLIITTPADFIVQLQSALEQHCRGWETAYGEVSYIDPLNAPDAKSGNVSMAKHFRFAYQKEYRIVWRPRVTTPKLSPITVTIGSLRDTCILVLLDDGPNDVSNRGSP